MSTSKGRCRWDGSERKTAVVWTLTEERRWEYWEKDAEDGTASKGEKEVYGCGERVHLLGWKRF